MSKGIAVVDIGSTGIRMLVAKVSEGKQAQIIAKADISAHDIIKNLEIDNSDMLTLALNKALVKIKTQTGIIVNSAYFSISSEKINQTNIFCSIKEEDVNDPNGDGTVTPAAVYALYSQVASEAEEKTSEKYIGCHTKNIAVTDGAFHRTDTDSPFGMPYATIGVDAIAYTSSDKYIQNVADAAKNAGLSVDGFIPHFNIAKYTMAPEYLEPTSGDYADSILSIETGAEAIQYVVFYKGVPYCYGAIPFGSRLITSDIAYVLKISPIAAEKLKIDFVNTNPELASSENNIEITLEDGSKALTNAGYVSKIAMARIDDILNKLSAEFQKIRLNLSMLGKIVVTGDGLCNFPGIGDVFEKKFNVRPEIFDVPSMTGMKSSFSDAFGMICYLTDEVGMSKRASSLKREMSSRDHFDEVETKIIQPDTESEKTEKQPKIISKIKNSIKNIIDSFKE